MMLPAPEIQDQQRNRQPSEDVLAAMSEVFNTLAATINLIPGNPHIRVAYLEPLDFASYRWIAAPRERLDLREKAGGSLAFLARDPAELGAS